MVILGPIDFLFGLHINPNVNAHGKTNLKLIS